jgi:4-carboxymuconolactone decarboxylase
MLLSGPFCGAISFDGYSYAEGRFFMSLTSPPSPLSNAVLDDPHLQAQLSAVNQAFGQFCTRVAGEVWGLPLIDQPTKALVAIAIDVVNQGLTVDSAFEAHVRMALKQAISFEQIEEILLFCCVYAGFNKVAPAFVRLAEIRQRIEVEA